MCNLYESLHSATPPPCLAWVLRTHLIQCMLMQLFHEANNIGVAVDLKSTAVEQRWKVDAACCKRASPAVSMPPQHGRAELLMLCPFMCYSLPMAQHTFQMLEQCSWSWE